MNNPTGKIMGDDLTNLLDKEYNLHLNHIINKLSQLDATDTFYKWHHIVLSIEEFINIPLYEIDDINDMETILSTPLSMNFLENEQLINAIKIIQNTFDNNIATRFINLLVMTIAINHSFKLHGINLFDDDTYLDTIGNAVVYYQSRRRYFITLLYLIPKISKGIQKISNNDLLNELLHIIEVHCIPVTSINHKQILHKIYSDFYVVSDGHAVTGNYHYQPLDELFLEPERISIVDQMIYRNEQITQLELFTIPEGKVFSTSELKNSILLIESAYAFYEIEDSDFIMYKNIIFNLLKHSDDNYFISISKKEFEKIIVNYSNTNKTKIYNNLLNHSTDYIVNLNSFHPLIELNLKYVSNVNLLMRFLYYFKNIFLNRKKRFQIHAGFVFEDIVKQELSNAGFFITDIKRINRKEFDVVTIKNNIIYNFQCKNNLIDLTYLQAFQKKFIRYNKYLVNYYSKALLNEEHREGLLQNKLSINTINHYVVSRFPVITNNERIISFNNLQNFAKEI
ncbi:MAG: hypothetical protein PHQ90_01085 [Sulfuricurvum sp.]|uniref:hypothetical protein n=1 Tax=Sulfuricurvum sp. TaxID=2025608 RepID=UPI0026100D67|nr:hypothetical protein [Sulfuricurvum sp.]MDD2367861.1 hypothetical protein [Sulfuricurvum sp.]MDD2951177.1 hypothetical protein [Sulfuricurvum sp.]MDD5119010.1 hypothetical protein [Sulfuricurvum sp.]